MDDRILHHLQGCDEIWHAGDWGTLAVADQLRQIAPVVGVYGNVDGGVLRRDFPEHQHFEREGHRIWMTHIGGYPGRYDRRVREEIQRTPPDIFVDGHSHILKVMPDKKLGLLHINPGAAGLQGFHKKRTLVLMELLPQGPQNLRVVELKRE